MDKVTASTSVNELTENNIPGAVLHAPLESATVHALRWWLLCHGIQPPSSWRKAKLTEKYCVLGALDTECISTCLV